MKLSYDLQTTLENVVNHQFWFVPIRVVEAVDEALFCLKNNDTQIDRLIQENVAVKADLKKVQDENALMQEELEALRAERAELGERYNQMCFANHQFNQAFSFVDKAIEMFRKPIKAGVVQEVASER